MSIAPVPDTPFELTVETLIVGAGAAGLVAALAAHEAGEEVLILEGDPTPAGSTALSAGLIPAPGTQAQKAAGIEDSPEAFAADIMKKAHDENDPEIVRIMAEGAGPLIDWLSDSYDLPFTVVDDFDYPGHSRRRMHGLPSRAGRELVDRLRATVEAQDIPIITERHVETLFADDAARIHGVEATRPDGEHERIGCDRLILACNGFGGDKQMVSDHMPAIGDALYFGHPGNRGDAVRWGEALGASTTHLGAYQGHGNVAHPHGILITWATITQGGIQVNTEGRRFWDESQGYSEAARAVLAQPGGIAFAIFDSRIAGIARQFADFQDAEAQGAVKSAETLDELAGKLSLPADALRDTVESLPWGGTDAFGRTFPEQPLAPPYCGVRVTGALFHTQGGLTIDTEARVLSTNGAPLPNLFAAGGAACGVSGSGDSGYLSGNGLLSAVVLGRIAGGAGRG